MGSYSQERLDFLRREIDRFNTGPMESGREVIILQQVPLKEISHIYIDERANWFGMTCQSDAMQDDDAKPDVVIER